MNFTDPFKTNIFKLNATSVCLFEVTNFNNLHVTMMNPGPGNMVI